MNQLFQKLRSTRKINLSVSSLLVKSKKLVSSKAATEFREKFPGDTCQLFLPLGCSSLVLVSPSRKTKSLRTSIKANLENSVPLSVQAWKALCSVTDFKFHDIKLLNSKLQEEALIRYSHKINSQKLHSSVFLFRFLFLLLVLVVVLFVCFKPVAESHHSSLSAENDHCTTQPLILALPAFTSFSFLLHLCTASEGKFGRAQSHISFNSTYKGTYHQWSTFPSPTRLHS